MKTDKHNFILPCKFSLRQRLKLLFGYRLTVVGNMTVSRSGKVRKVTADPLVHRKGRLNMRHRKGGK